MEIADMLDYVEEIGALGGTLSLEYNDGIVTLTGDELIQAANDYDMSEPFVIVDTPEESWELVNAVDIEPYELSNTWKVLSGVFFLSVFAVSVWVLMT